MPETINVLNEYMDFIRDGLAYRTKSRVIIAISHRLVKANLMGDK